MSYEDIPVDLSTAKAATETVGKITAEIRKLHDGNATKAEVNEAVEKVAGEFKENLRLMNERYAHVNKPTENFGGDAEVSRYLPHEGDEVERASKGTYAKNSEGAVQLYTRHFADGGHAPGLLDDAPRTEWQAELQGLASKRSLVRSCQASPSTPGLDRQIARHMRTAPPSIRRIFADQAGIGAEWIADTFSSTLERDVFAPRPIPALFREIVVPPGGQFRMPYRVGGLTPYIGAAPTADDPAQFRKTSLTTDERTTDPVKFVVNVQIDEDASEDSLIAVEPELRFAISQAFADSQEDTILNGDLAGTRDLLASWNPRNRWEAAGLGVTADHRRAYDGLREVALDAAQANNSADRSGAITATGLRGDIKTLTAAHWLNGQTGIAIIPTPEYYLGTMLGFAEVITVDVAGALATFQTGQLASAWGYPIHLSEFMTPDLNATGVFDNVTVNLGGMIIVSTSRFRRFRRRGQRIRLQTDITRGVVNMVADGRWDFKKISPLAEKNVRYAFNLPT